MNECMNGSQARKQTDTCELTGSALLAPHLGQCGTCAGCPVTSSRRCRTSSLLHVHQASRSDGPAASPAQRGGSFSLSCCVPAWDTSPPLPLVHPCSPCSWLCFSLSPPLPWPPPPNQAASLHSVLFLYDTHSHLSLLWGLSICLTSAPRGQEPAVCLRFSPGFVQGLAHRGKTLDK